MFCRRFTKLSVSLVLWMRLKSMRQVRPPGRPSFRFPNFCTDTTAHPLHTAPRLPEMDTSVWEVNFNHRDDALSALMVSPLNGPLLAALVLNLIRR